MGRTCRSAGATSHKTTRPHSLSLFQSTNPRIAIWEGRGSVFLHRPPMSFSSAGLLGAARRSERI